MQDGSEEHDAPTSIARVPEALLRSLRKDEPKKESEPDEDESATLLMATTGRVGIPRPSTPGSAPLPNLHAETEGSPDEDRSDTGITGVGVDIPPELRRGSSSRMPVATVVPNDAPMFEPPPPEMMAPRPPPPPPEHVPFVAARPVIPKQLATTLASRRHRRHRWGLVVAVALAAFSGGALLLLYFTHHLHLPR